MNDRELIEWLMENGGSAIRLRLAEEIGAGLPSSEYKGSVAELLEIEAVQQLLGYLDAFSILEQTEGTKKLIHDLIHCYRETSLENFFPRLLSLGLRAGMPVLDEKMQVLRRAFPRISREGILYGWVICEFCFKAGYAYPEMVTFMQQRLDALQMSAQEQIVDIYFKEDELAGLPSQWKGKRIIKHELNPYAGSKPLPTVHDIAAFAYFPASHLDAEMCLKIDRLVSYILLPAFQMIPEGYGFIWYPKRRICHACGWSPTIPFYQGFERPLNFENWWYLDYLDMLSRFSIVSSTDWFINSLERLEQFKTNKGTYLFPEVYFHHKRIDAAFLSKANQTLKRSDKTTLYQELVSTIFALKIKQRAQW